MVWGAGRRGAPVYRDGLCPKLEWCHRCRRRAGGRLGIALPPVGGLDLNAPVCPRYRQAWLTFGGTADGDFPMVAGY
jgi:hypothetical protein